MRFEDVLQTALEVGELPGTPSESAAIEYAWRSGLRSAAVVAESYGEMSIANAIRQIATLSSGSAKETP